MGSQGKVGPQLPPDPDIPPESFLPVYDEFSVTASPYAPREPDQLSNGELWVAHGPNIASQTTAEIDAVYPTSNSDTWRNLAINFLTPKQKVEGQFHGANASGNTRYHALFARYDVTHFRGGAQTGWFIQRKIDATSAILRKEVAGVPTTVATFGSLAAYSDERFRIDFDDSNNLVFAYAADVLLATYDYSADPDFAALVALRTSGVYCGLGFNDQNGSKGYGANGCSWFRSTYNP